MGTNLLEKLLEGLFVLGGTVYGKWQLRRLMSSMIVIAWLVIMAAMSASALLVGSFYGCYLALLHYGVDPQNATFVALLLFAITTALFVFLTLMCLQRLSGKLWRQSPLTAHAGEVMDAFMEGFNG